MESKPASRPAYIPVERIIYLDNIKVLLTILVVVHHAFVAYGAPGGWYYRQVATDEHALIPLTFVVLANQSFFMGLFFLISGYFTEPSLKRKGIKLFLADRFKRLGIPLIFFALVLSPVTGFLVRHFGMLKNVTLFQYLSGYDHWTDFGVLWFLSSLLFFNLIFVVLYKLRLEGSKHISNLNGTSILLIGACLGLVSFLVRIIYPMNTAISIFGFHLGQFPQYIVLFIIGIMAGRGDLAQNISLKLTKHFAWLAVIMLFAGYLLIAYIKNQDGGSISNLYGGLSVKALLYSLYEQIMGIAIMVALTAIIKYRWNNQTPFSRKLSRNALAVYIIHPIVLVSISLILSRFATTPTIKLAVAVPTAVICSFFIANLVMRIPGVNKVL